MVSVCRGNRGDLKMVAKNDVTGDLIKSRVNTKEFEESFDRIFGTKKEPQPTAVKQEQSNDVRSKRNL